jgi:hypothetical protein|mmetsp:Transcript_34520/g.45406  ORF Transcript_34520/g.45406 Transcript_34520/m.45406 type:complete len:434 (+) Transcript_34520:26-1327(+)
MDFVELLQHSQETRISIPTRMGLTMTASAVYMDKTCDEMKDTGFMDGRMGHAAIIVVYSMISMLITGGVALMMSNNKHLMAHPNKLIFYMCICEGIVAWQAMITHLGPQEIICYFGLDHIFVKTVFWSVERDEKHVMRMLAMSNFNILQFFELVSLAINLLLCLDIVFTMRNPFYPHDRRMKFYLPTAILFAACAFNMCLARISEPPNNGGLDNYQRAMFSVGFISIYLIISISSVAYAYRVNTRPGMSTEVRRDFIWRHSAYVATYIITWLPYLGFAYYILFATTVEGHDIAYQQLVDDKRYGKALTGWFNAYNISCIGTGIVMSFVRIQEPIFKHCVYTYIYEYFGEIYEANAGSSKTMDSTLLNFLMSSYNIELVHIILTTVSKNTVGTPKSVGDYKVYRDYDHTNMNQFVLDSIEIEDRKQWEVGNVVA